MKTIILFNCLALICSFSVFGQPSLSVIQNPQNIQETRTKAPALRLIFSQSSQPNLVKYNLNDAPMSFRIDGTALVDKYYLQVFEDWNYSGNSAMLKLPTGLLNNTKWANSISSFKLFELKRYASYGGSGGGDFSDNLPTDSQIRIINVWSGAYIDAIQVIWEDAQGNLITGQKHGGNGGGLTVINLQKGEYINNVSGSAGTYLDHLTLRTNRGRVFSMGEMEVKNLIATLAKAVS